MKPFRFWIVFALFLLFVAMLRGEELGIELRINPKFVLASMTSAQVEYKILVEPHPDNRLLTFNTATNGPGQMDSREWQLDGEYERKVFPLCLLPKDPDKKPAPCFATVNGGEDYLFTACVHRVQPNSNKLKAICATEKVEVK